MSGKRYPEEFKIEAVKQVIDRGHSVSSVATRLDITTHIEQTKKEWCSPHLKVRGTPTNCLSMN